MTTASTVGVDGFLANIQACGATPVITGTVVTFEVDAPVGTYAGRCIPTGVGLDELGSWPELPPHWVHLPDWVTFRTTNIDRTGVLPGWSRHSRQIQSWGNATVPGQAWISHVRSVLAEDSA